MFLPPSASNGLENGFEVDETNPLMWASPRKADLAAHLPGSFLAFHPARTHAPAEGLRQIILWGHSRKRRPSLARRPTWKSVQK